MTGRDLIMYILKHGLEDEPIFNDGVFIGLMSTDETAVKMGVGTATIDTMIELKMLDSVEIKSGIYIIPSHFNTKE